ARSDAIEKRLDTDVSHVWMRGCLSDQMLAAAEADFQRYSPSSREEGAGGWGETRCKAVRPTSCPLPSRGREKQCIDIDQPLLRHSQMRQQTRHQPSLARLQCPRCDPAEGSQVSGISCQKSAPDAVARTRRRFLYLIRPPDTRYLTPGAWPCANS